ncbi:MAG: toll/interleukin-1 receptor domain-containing protein [Solirubrobacteraceae bacterium]
MRSQIENRAESQEVQGLDGLERYDAFISYAREDSAFVVDEGGLLEALGKQGLSVWLDVEAIPGGADFHTRIRRGIETSNGFVFVMTPDSVASEECRRELEFAIELGKLIIPSITEMSLVATYLRSSLTLSGYFYAPRRSSRPASSSSAPRSGAISSGAISSRR